MTLTAAGERMLGQARVAFEHFANDSLEAFDDQDRGEFARLIDKLR